MAVLVLVGCARGDLELDVAQPASPEARLDAGRRSPGAELDAAPASRPDGAPPLGPSVDAAAADSGPDAAGDAAAPDAGDDAGVELDASAGALDDAGVECMRRTDGTDDCPDGSWCRRTECVPFVGEGELCGGWVQEPERCAPGLSCSSSYPPNNDGPGLCHLRCTDDADCGEGRYCSSYFHMCFDDGTCLHSLDCDEPGNAYPRDACTGYGTCTGRSCSYSCGDPACRDVSNIALGGCLGSVYAVRRDECVRVNACEGREVTLFDSLQACIDTCMP